jgi:hypothetical protein
MDVFTYRLTAKNPKISATEKRDKKFQQLFLSFIFYLSFTGDETKSPFAYCCTFYIRIKIYKRG